MVRVVAAVLFVALPLTLQAEPVSSGPEGKIVAGFTLASSVIHAPDPHLPSAIWDAHPEGIVKGMYKICLDVDGHVSGVTPMTSIPDADDLVMQHIRDTWLYKPQPLPVCFAKPFAFRLVGTAPPVQPAANAQTTTTTQTASASSPAEIRAAADAFIDAIIRGARASAFQQMWPAYRAKTTEQGFEKVLDRYEARSGKVLEAEYKTFSVGPASTDPRLKVWALLYAVRTTRYEKGAHFVKIEVLLAPDAKIFQISLVEHTPDPIPPELK